jgi:hypothetical protein
LAPLDSRVKDPRLVAAGKKAMRNRWGPPRTARLDELDPVARRIVTLIIEADQHAREAAAEPDKV